MDWLDAYLDNLADGRNVVYPPDKNTWTPVKPNRQQQSIIQDAVAFDQQCQMRMIPEARQELEAHGMSHADVADGIGADPGSPAVQQSNIDTAAPGLTRKIYTEYLGGYGLPNPTYAELNAAIATWTPVSTDTVTTYAYVNIPLGTWEFTGYFVAPANGFYIFRPTNVDDYFFVELDGVPPESINYANGITLQAGQAVHLRILYANVAGPGSITLTGEDPWTVYTTRPAGANSPDLQVPSQPSINDPVAGDAYIFIEAYVNNDEAPDASRPVDSWQYRVNGGAWIPYAGNPPAWQGGDVTLTDLTNGVTYTVDVRAVNTVGPGQYSTFIGTPAAVPTAPIFNSLTNGPTCDTVVVNFTPQFNGGAPIQGYFLYSYRGPDGEIYSDFFNGPSPATVSCPGAGGSGMSQAQIYAYNEKGDSGGSEDIFNLDVNACHIRISGSTYSFLNGTFDRRNSGYEVRREDEQPYDGFKYTGTTYAYTPSAANDQVDGANIIMGPNTTLTDISDNYTIYTNPNKWSYLVYSYDPDTAWQFNEVFSNASTSPTIPLGTWIAAGGWGSNITVS